MKSVSFENIRSHLLELTNASVLIGLKAGTEAEDLNYEEILFLRKLSDDRIPLYVKIGGPEARNDIRELVSRGVDGLIAPMVESEYALRKFIQALRDVLTDEQFNRLNRSINLETMLAVTQLPDILKSPAFREIHRVTAARSDLSESLNLDPDDEKITATCRHIIDSVRTLGCLTSTGGNIHPGNIEKILKEIGSDQVNTRNLLMNAKFLARDPVVFMKEFLNFEISLNHALADFSPGRAALHEERARILEFRLQTGKNVVS